MTRILPTLISATLCSLPFWYEPQPHLIVDPARIAWEFDSVRAERKRLDEQEAWAREFNRTNTNPAMTAIIQHNFVGSWTPQKGQRELGYRSDGIAVWRLVPEANP